MKISPNYTDNDWKELNFNKEEDFEKGIEIFKDRIDMRFLNPISDIERKEYTGFLIMALDCLLIETLQQFIEGVPETPSGKSKYYFKKIMVSYFKGGFNEKKAEMFYEQIRCGLLHQAETKASSKIKKTSKLPIVKFTKDKNGLIINRRKFHKKFKELIKSYIAKLKDTANKSLRENFIKKMNFICKIECQD
ncbi:hypothetical protein KJ813_08475 [bacterium]|nr:hypothetical protein [bacterium]